MQPGITYNQQNFGYGQQYGQQNQYSQIERLRSFQHQLQNYSMREMALMQGHGTSLGARALSYASRAGAFITAGQFGQGYNMQEASRALGYGVTPKYMQQSDFDRTLTQARERRERHYKELYGRLGSNQYGRDFANVFGAGDLYDNEYFRKGVNFLNRISPVSMLTSLARGKGLFGTEDLIKDTRKERDVLRTARQLEAVMDRSISRRDLQDTRFGKGVSTDAAYRVAEAFADPERLKSMLTTRELKDFKNLSGLDKHFTTGEMAQIFNRMSQAGDFRGTQTSMRYDPASGRMVRDEDMTTPEGRARAIRKAADRQAVMALQGARNIQRVQKKFQVQDVGEAEALTRLLAGDGRISDLKEQDLDRIKNLQKHLGLSLKGISQVLKMGNQIADQMGLTKTMGQTMVLQNMQSVRTITEAGFANENDMKSIGGEQGLAREMMGFRQNRLSTRQGKLERGIFGYINKLRERDPRAAAALEAKIRRRKMQTGQVTGTDYAEAVFAATGQRIDPGHATLHMERNQATIDEASKGVDVEGQHLADMVRRARDRFQGLSGGDLERAKSRLQQDLINRGVTRKLAAFAANTNNPEELDRAFKDFAKGSGLPEASRLVAELNKRVASGDLSRQDAAFLFDKQMKGLRLTPEMRKALQAKLGSRQFLDQERLYKTIRDETGKSVDTGLTRDLELVLSKDTSYATAERKYNEERDKDTAALREKTIKWWADKEGVSADALRDQIVAAERDPSRKSSKLVQTVSARLRRMEENREKFSFSKTEEGKRIIERVRKEQEKKKAEEKDESAKETAESTKTLVSKTEEGNTHLSNIASNMKLLVSKFDKVVVERKRK